MSSPSVLHIINSFAISRIYASLAYHLDELGVPQKIYSAVRSKKEAEYSPENISHIPIYCHNILKRHDVLFFRSKIRKIFRDITNHITHSDVSLIHAHTLYSDGAVALKWKKKFGIPYIVAIRSGDIVDFDRLRPDLKFIRKDVLLHAEKVIFISPVYKKQFLDSLHGSLKKAVTSKSEVIPNGIDSTYFKTSNISPKHADTSSGKGMIKILYIGSFVKRKNVPVLIESVSKVAEKHPVTLTIVGSGGDQQATVMQMISSGRYPFINYLGNVSDIEKLRSLYQSHDIFAMVSWQETFGLVYIEALSQGLPVIYAKGEGIDGYFDDREVGEVVYDLSDVNEIAAKIVTLFRRRDDNLHKSCIERAKQFNWSKIAQTYREIYAPFL